MKRYIKPVALLLAVFLTVGLFIVNKRGGNAEPPLPTIDKEETDFRKMNEDLGKELTGSPVVQDINCLDKEDKAHKLSGFVSEGPVLVYRYSELHCSYCYETELASLQASFADEKYRVIVLCTYRIKKYFTASQIINRIKLPLYRIPFEAFTWKVEHSGTPYYFVLHPDMTASRFYVPDNTYPAVNADYFEAIKNLIQ